MRTKELLIVDSNRKRAEVYYSEIRHLFDDFHIAETHSEARALITVHDFFSIIVSPFVPDGTIRDFLKELRSNSKTRIIPVIVISNLPERSEKIDYYSYGADEYFELPVDRELFRETVRREILQYERISSNMTPDDDPEAPVVSQSAFLEKASEIRADMKDSPEDVSLVLVAPVAIDFITKQYGQETSERVFEILGQLMKENCKGRFFASRWTRKSLVVMVRGKNREEIRQTLNEARKLLLEKVDFIPRLKETPGLRAVITEFTPDEDIEDLLQKMSSQLGYISMYNKEPVQILEQLEIVKKEIVIADPDIVSVNIMSHRLTQEGFKVNITDNPAAIEDISKDGDLAVVLIDTMVEDGGLELIAKLRGQSGTETVPILVLSRYGHDEDVVEAFKAGANDYMLKPLSLTELSARIKRLSNR